MEVPEGTMNYIVARCVVTPTKDSFFRAFIDGHSTGFPITNSDSIEKLNEILKEGKYKKFPDIHLSNFPPNYTGIPLWVTTIKCERGTEGNWNINGTGRIDAQYSKQDSSNPIGIVPIEFEVSGKINLHKGDAILNLLRVD